jgi:AraC family ethanolamine operon transcriptional activator
MGAALGHHGRDGGVESSLSHSLIAAIAEANNKTSLSDDAAKSSRKIMTRALEYVRRHKWQVLHVNDLARAAKVTERTLLRSFRQQLGIGPARYLKLRQLNVVRRALRGKLGNQLKVTAIMRDHGVSEFGRFAAEYKSLFGEGPSETKRRHV